MNARVVYLNGRFVPESDAKVSLFDSSLTYGDMAYEVTRTIHGQPFRLGEHLDRLRETLSALRVDVGLSRAEWERITLETLARNRPTEAEDVDWQIMHSVSRGPVAAYRRAFAPEEMRPTIIVHCYPLLDRLGRAALAYDTGLDLVIPQQRSLPADLLPAVLKTRCRLHFLLANLQAEAITPGATAVLLDTSGCLTEGTTGNVFLVRDRRLFTPTGRDILLGVTRRVVLDLARKLGVEAVEADLVRADALAADELFMTSTSIGILHGRSIEGQVIGDGRIGPVTLRLRQALFAEVGLDFADQARAYAARTTA